MVQTTIGSEWSLSDRFIKMGSVHDKYSGEATRHPDWGPGDFPGATPSSLTGELGSPVIAAKKFGEQAYPRFPPPMCTSTENDHRPDMGPTVYSHKPLPPNPASLTMGHELRFNIVSEERRMQEARASYPMSLSYQTTDRDFWTRNAAPDFKGDDRWLSPRSKSVLSPMAYLKKRAGFHLSAMVPRTDPRILRMSRRPKELLGTLRSINLPVDKADGVERPYQGFELTLNQRCKRNGNLTKCTIASQVERTRESVIGSEVTEYGRRPHMGPGDGFDASDQYMSNQTWGRHSTWARWQEQHSGGYRATCPFQQEEEKKERRRVTSEPQTIQAKAHQLYHKGIEHEKDWATDPQTRKSWEQYDADHKARAERAKKREQVGVYLNDDKGEPGVHFGNDEKRMSTTSTPCTSPSLTPTPSFFKGPKPGTPNVTSSEATITNVTL